MESIQGRLDPEDFDYFLNEINLSFWIELTQQDVRNAPTFGDLFDTMISRMGTFDSSRCLTSVAFYRLRRSLIDVSGMERRSIRPSTPLRGLLSPKAKLAWWEVIQNDLRFRLPRLRLGRAAIIAYWAIAVVAAILYLLTESKGASWEAKFAGPFAIVLIVWLLRRATVVLPRELPAETLGDLVRIVVTLNQKRLIVEAGGTTEGQAWLAFRELLPAALGISAKSITRETPIPSVYENA